MAITTPVPLATPYRIPRARRATSTQLDPEVERVRRFARILDHYMVDPILGFVLPGAGDVIGSLLGLYTVALAIRKRLSPVIIARMLLNLAIDAAIGIVPLLGDAADVAFKANEKNVALLSDRHAAGGHATPRDYLAVLGAAALFGAVIGLAIYAIGRLVHALA
jgi:hypothetical protein